MIAWSPELIDEHCSSWTIIQTLGWFNVIDVQWTKFNQSWKLTLGDASILLSEQSLPTEEADHTRGRILGINAALRQRRRWLRDESLRYCPICIQSGMHYRYQQDLRFRRCILHRRNLKTGCPCCGVALDTRGTAVLGFICKACGETLLKCSIPGTTQTPRKRSETCLLDELDRWLTAADESTKDCQAVCSERAPPLWLVRGRYTDASRYWHALTLHPNARIKSALVPFPASFKRFPTAALSAPLSRHLKDQKELDPIQPYRDLLKCVARRLRRSYLRGHAACRIHATRSLDISTSRIQRPVSLKPHLCCIAQAYAIWLFQRRIELEQTNAQLLHVILGHKIEVRLPSLRDAALSYISSFEAWVQSLARLQSLVHRSNRSSFLYDCSSTPPHWALFQDGASRSCPVHLRADCLRDLGRCDKGRVLRDERDMVIAMGRRRRRLLASVRPPAPNR